MKKIILLIGIMFLSGYVLAQNVAQLDSTTLKSQPLIKMEKGGLLKDVDVIANMRFASNNNFANSNFVNSAFQVNELRMEIIGKVTDNLSFRFRDRYANNSTDANTTDRLNHSVDLVYAEYAVSPKFSVTAGKMLSEWGSYELYLNPVYMYAYNDMVQYGDFFLAGVRGNWAVAKDHSLTLQIVNSNTRSFDYRYGDTPGIEAAKAPLGGTLNWKGNFADDKFSTMWSYSYYNLAKNQHWSLIALGNQFQTSKLTLQYDFKYSNEDLDNTGTISRLLDLSFANKAKDVHYMEHWIRGEYFFAPKWSTTVYGMVNSAYWKGNPDNSADKNDLIRTRWSFSAALEYHIQPSIKVFATYIGRYDKYTDYAQQRGLSNGNTGQVLIGILGPLKIF